MLQSRKIPYRTHSLPNSKDSPMPLPPGRYAGRVLELETTKETTQVCIFLEDQYFWFTTNSHYPYFVGELLTFEVTAKAHLRPLESLSNSTHPPTKDALRWRGWGSSVSRMNRLKQRHRMMQKIRACFDQQGFLEVDTPLRVKAPSPEPQFTPFLSETNFLITSPEFQMKRMLGGGFEKIYQITSCFRSQESGTWHNPEFTMLEWYRAFDRLETLVGDLENLVAAMATISPHVEGHCLKTQTAQVCLKPPWECRSVNELFQQHLNLDLKNALSATEIKKTAMDGGYSKAIENVPLDYEQIFCRLWNLFESHLGKTTPLLVYDWPLPLASLAQARTDNPNVAERMEFYIAGVELANGFGELTHAVEQKQRFEKNLQERTSQEKPTVPLDEAFLQSLQEGIPPSAGMALGVDRLVMLFTGASHIREVLCFAHDEL